MPASPDVEAWFQALDHPLNDAMRRVRSIVLAMDDRVEEEIKWRSPAFMFEGNIASIDPRTKKHVNLMFHQARTSRRSTCSWRAEPEPSASCGSRAPRT